MKGGILEKGLTRRESRMLRLHGQLVGSIPHLVRI